MTRDEFKSQTENNFSLENLLNLLTKVTALIAAWIEIKNGKKIVADVNLDKEGE